MKPDSVSTLDLPGWSVRYTERGQGPALVHLHGAGGQRWDGTKLALAERFRVISPEFPGFGEPPLSADVQSLPDLARLTADFIHRVAGGPAHVLGSSFGGRVATWLALLEPTAIDRLVLESPASFRPPDRPGLADLTADQVAARLTVDGSSRPAGAADPDAHQRNVKAIAHLTRNNPPEAELLDRLREIETPTLVVFGTQDRMIPPENGRLYKERMADCTLAFVYGAGHLIRHDRPDAFVRLVADFLVRGPAFVVARGPTTV